jgi:hypothetical protein
MAMNQTRNLLAPPLLLLASLCGLAACEGGSNAERVLELHGQRLAFAGGVFDILADDLSGNGLLDLVFTSHEESFSQVFHQRSARHFEPGLRMDDVGFHPGNFIRLANQADGMRRYLMSAEGIHQLQVYGASEDAGLELSFAIDAPAPRYSTTFTWPTGQGLATAPFIQGLLLVIEGFDPLAGKAAYSHMITLPHDLSSLGPIVAADLNGDGIDELILADAPMYTVWRVRAPEPGQTPVVEPLWQSGNKIMFDEVRAADVDQDGDQDILVPQSVFSARRLDQDSSSAQQNAVVQVLANDGKGNFTEGPVIQHPNVASADRPARVIADLAFGQDGDEAGYLLVATGAGVTLIRLLGAGEIDPSPEWRFIPAGGPGAAAMVRLVDLDQDGWLDAVIGHGGSVGGALILYGPLWQTFDTLVGAGSSLLPEVAGPKPNSTGG